MKMEYLKDVVTLKRARPEQCIGCGMCVNVCPHNVFKIENRKAVMINRDSCMECGACKKNCPAGVIEVREGVGCAAALIYGMIRKTDPQCGCCGSDEGKKGCC